MGNNNGHKSDSDVDLIKIKYYYYVFNNKSDTHSIDHDNLTVKRNLIDNIHYLYANIAKIFNTQSYKIHIHQGNSCKGWELSQRMKTPYKLKKIPKQIFIERPIDIEIKYYYNMYQYKRYSFPVFGCETLVNTMNIITYDNIILSSLIIKRDNNDNSIVHGYLRIYFGNNNDININHLILKYYCGDMDINIWSNLYENNIFNNTTLNVYKDYKKPYIEYSTIHDDISVTIEFKNTQYSVKVKPKDKFFDLEKAIRLFFANNNIYANIDYIMNLKFDGSGRWPSKTIMDFELYTPKIVFVSVLPKSDLARLGIYF